MMTLFWLAVWLVPPAKFDSFLQSLPILAPLWWVVIWFLCSFALGIAAYIRSRRFVWMWTLGIAFTSAAYFLIRLFEGALAG